MSDTSDYENDSPGQDPENDKINVHQELELSVPKEERLFSPVTINPSPLVTSDMSFGILAEALDLHVRGEGGEIGGIPLQKHNRVALENDLQRHPFISMFILESDGRNGTPSNVIPMEPGKKGESRPPLILMLLTQMTQVKTQSDLDGEITERGELVTNVMFRHEHPKWGAVAAACDKANVRANKPGEMAFMDAYTAPMGSDQGDLSGCIATLDLAHDGKRRAFNKSERRAWRKKHGGIDRLPTDCLFTLIADQAKEWGHGIFNADPRVAGFIQDSTGSYYSMTADDIMGADVVSGVAMPALIKDGELPAGAGLPCLLCKIAGQVDLKNRKLTVLEMEMKVVDSSELNVTAHNPGVLSEANAARPNHE